MAPCKAEQKQMQQRQRQEDNGEEIKQYLQMRGGQSRSLVSCRAVRRTRRVTFMQSGRWRRRAASAEGVELQAQGARRAQGRPTVRDRCRGNDVPAPRADTPPNSNKTRMTRSATVSRSTTRRVRAGRRVVPPSRKDTECPQSLGQQGSSSRHTREVPARSQPIAAVGHCLQELQTAN